MHTALHPRADARGRARARPARRRLVHGRGRGRRGQGDRRARARLSRTTGSSPGYKKEREPGWSLAFPAAQGSRSGAWSARSSADLALVLCVAAVTTVVFRRLRQPVVLGYLLAGLIVGPYTPVPLVREQRHAAHALGARRDPGHVLDRPRVQPAEARARLPRAGLVGLVDDRRRCCGSATRPGRALGWPNQQCFFAGAMVAISSTMIIAKVFAERRRRAAALGPRLRRADHRGPGRDP